MRGRRTPRLLAAATASGVWSHAAVTEALHRGPGGEPLIREAGLNRWADVHRVVVVYPQAQSSYVPLDPNACWDWWGYGGADCDNREGGRIRFAAAILDRLAGAR